MTSDIRAVLDTNVVISAALLSHSTPRRAFDWVLEHGTHLISFPAVAEIGEVLRRASFDRYLRVEERSDFLAALVRVSELVEVTVSMTVCRDPKDDKFLELALSGTASHIVTGDADLLSMHPFRGVSILSPHQFVTERDARV